MRIFEGNRPVTTVIATLVAAGFLTVGGLVYAAGGADDGARAFDTVMASAGAPTAGAPAQDGFADLRRAAERGDVLAIWKLARMYDEGNGVAQDQLAALQYYSQIADQNPEVYPRSEVGRIVARAFTRLAAYYQTGIAGTSIVRNDERAARLLTHAATYFAAPDAQYELGKLYLEGRGVEQSTRRAINWLLLAARKRHIQAQCLLGSVLLAQAGDKPAQTHRARVSGLMWFELARRSADPARQIEAIADCDGALVMPTSQEAALAATAADKWLAKQAR